MFSIEGLEFRLPFRRFTRPEWLRDSVGDEVLIAAVDLADDRAAALFELPEGRAPLLLSVGIARSHRGRDAVGYFVGDLDRSNHVPEQIGEALLADVGVPALALEPGAAVVDVLALLLLRGHRAATVGAGEQPHERMTPLGGSHVRRAVELGLDPIEELVRDQGLVRALAPLTAPEEVAGVDRVLEHPVEFGNRHRAIAAPVPKADVVRPRAKPFQRVLTRPVELEHPGDERPPDRIDVNPAGDTVVDVADVRHAWPVALLRLLAQSLLDLLAQVVHVVLGHQHFDAMHKLLGRPGVLRDDRVLFREMDFEIEIVHRDPVADVAVEAVGLLDEDASAGRVRLEEGQHLAEAAAAGLFGGLDVDEFSDDRQAMLSGVLTQRLLLGGNREALTFLVFR